MVFGGNPNKTGKVSPLASTSVLYDVMNDILVDVSLLAYRYNERKSAKAHMNFLPGFPHSIIAFARGYPSSDNQESLTLRSIHFLLNDGSTEYLVTNLMPEQMESEKFPELYRLRWGVESKYRELKNRLEIEAFNSVKPVSIQQEFFAAMYLSNLAAIIKSEADLKVIASADNRHNYQPNHSYILNRIKNYIIHLLRSSSSACNKMISQIVKESAKILSVIRSNRKFGRYRKHTRRRYYNHMKSCI